jgi:hypothetical protein
MNAKYEVFAVFSPPHLAWKLFNRENVASGSEQFRSLLYSFRTVTEGREPLARVEQN